MSDILSELDIDPDDFDWKSFAYCKNVNPRTFYEEYEDDPVSAAATDEMCLSCPVFKWCMETAQENGEWGCWAAIYWNGSGKPDPNRNLHKTPEVWEKIRDRVNE